MEVAQMRLRIAGEHIEPATGTWKPVAQNWSTHWQTNVLDKDLRDRVVTSMLQQLRGLSERADWRNVRIEMQCVMETTPVLFDGEAPAELVRRLDAYASTNFPHVEGEQWVVVEGDPFDGFEVWGPYHRSEAETAVSVGNNVCWMRELRLP